MKVKLNAAGQLRAFSEFSLLQADNATGNFVKIAQRIPVRITVDKDQPQAQRLRPGMSVVVSIDTGYVVEDERGASQKGDED